MKFRKKFEEIKKEWKMFLKKFDENYEELKKFWNKFDEIKEVNFKKFEEK